MQPKQWAEIAATIQARWPHADLPMVTIEQWGRDLSDLPAEQIAVTVEVIYRTGREFPPNAGQIRARLIELAIGAPEWGAVLAELRGLASKSGRDLPLWTRNAHDELVPIDERAEALAAADPLIRAFAHTYGWSQIRSGIEGGNGEARLRDLWRIFVERAQREVALGGLPTAGLRELERIDKQPKRLGDALSDVVAELEPGEQAA